MEFTLYDYALSGNCYKIRLFASILGVDYEKISVEFHPSADHKSEAMLQVSPAGTLPILKTDEMVLSETQAMLFGWQSSSTVQACGGQRMTIRWRRRLFCNG